MRFPLDRSYPDKPSVKCGCPSGRVFLLWQHRIVLPYHHRWDRMPGACYPAIMVNSAVTKHLEVLGRMTVLSFCVIKGINHRRSIERKLLSAIHHLWKRQTNCFEHSWGNIYHMTELRPDLPLSFDSFGPMHHHSVASASPMRGNLLGPLERGIQSMCPANRIMRKSIRTSPVIYMIHHLGSSAYNAIQGHHLVIRSFRSALGAGAVIAYNVNKEG